LRYVSSRVEAREVEEVEGNNRPQVWSEVAKQISRLTASRYYFRYLQQRSGALHIEFQRGALAGCT
jgi:hypothetical protein